MGIDVTSGAEYTEVLRQLNLWYGQDSQKIVNIINTYGLSPEQVTQDYLSGSGFEPWYSSSNGIAGYNTVGGVPVNSGAGSAASALNSNVGATVQTPVKMPVETTYNQAGKLTASNGLTSVATGAKSALTFVAKEVLPAVSAAGLGIALGKTIDKTLYNLNPDFWDNAGMSSLNPDTWNSITQDYPDGFLKKAFNTVFGLNPETGETQLYLDADAAAYLAQYMQEQGVFSAGGSAETDLPIGLTYIQQPITLSNTLSIRRGNSLQTYTFVTRSAFWTDSNLQNKYVGIAIGDSMSEVIGHYTNVNTSTGTITSDYDLLTNASYSYNGNTVYYFKGGNNGTGTVDAVIGTSNVMTINNSVFNSTDFDKAAWILKYGNIQSGGPEGISTQDGATTPNFSGCTTLQDYKNALQNQFPDLFNNAVTQTVANPDGTTKTVTYIPVGTPSENNNGNGTQPVTDTNNSGNTQSNTIANPATVDLTGLENLIKQLTETLNQDGTPTDPQNPDPTGTGDTPPVIVPTGSASALWSVYNPTQAQLNAFGAWLWSSNFIDQVLKLFNNPMQSIIGVHKIFATPSISGSGNIVVGYLDSGVGANLVGAQYTTIDCGSINVREQFGNVFDYTDTTIRLYLPFIGIVDLDTTDVMRGTVNVIYHVDVITGACLAEVKISRDASGGTLYQFAGDAAVRYPISSGSYMGVVAGIASAVGGVASAIMTGGATLPMAAGAIAGGISGAHTQVQHSGNFSGNAGAMGAKKPYLIIERPQTMLADSFANYQGKGANTRRTVGQMSGYFKFSDVHTDSINGAAESEIEAIRAALESGVIA